jgi:anti-sigma28 factor (negative regulator of flagellin synthesis)
MRNTDTQKNEGIMQSYDDIPHPPVSPSSPQVRTIPAPDMKMGRPPRRVIDVDQMNFSLQLWEIQQASQMLTQILEIREMRIAVLRRDIESGHYCVKAEQVAEKIIEDQLLDLFYS